MKLLVEDYPYASADVMDIMDGLGTLQNKNGHISVSYVGYYYNPKIKDCVFILPKVVLDEPQKRNDGKQDNGYVFTKYRPELIIDLETAELMDEHRKFLYEFAVWIHRAIVVFNNANPDNTIVNYRQIESDGSGAKKRANTLLDIILSLIRFARENRSFFTFVLKNIHSGYNKINWNKTISGTSAVVENESPVYLNPINKRKQINFDEELLVIFFSILRYVADHYGFKTEIPFGFKLITGAKFERYINGYGRRRLRQIKYKYFSDTARRLWDLCYAFFDKAYQIKVSTTQSEYLLVKSFHVVFESIIDELIGDHDVPKGLKEQADGKLVDHFYTYDGLIVDRDNDIYYIGDSKYYKIGSDPGETSVYKQYTYARNVIQWNLNLFLDPKASKEEKDCYRSIELRDPVTEGYNVIPNFFISAAIDPDTLSYGNRTVPHEHQPPVSRQFENRLYDRDTLLVSHYDVNFLFVVSLYARNNSAAKAIWKDDVRREFRKAIQILLSEKFDFYAMTAHPDVDAIGYIQSNFQTILGKTFRPFESDEVFSLALDKDYPEENKKLLDELQQNFYVVKCPLGEDPSNRLQAERETVGIVDSPAGLQGKFLFGIVTKYKTKEGKQVLTKEYISFRDEQATIFVMRNMPSGDMTQVKYFVPMYDGGIRGYYEVTSITFGMRKQEITDESGASIIAQMPCLNINLGKYKSLGNDLCTVPKYRYWNGQIHSYSELMKLYNQQAQ